MYILDVCMNDLNCLFNHESTILLHMSLINLENEWSYPLINFCQAYGTLHVHIGCLCEWSHKSFQSQVCYLASYVPIHLENEWSYLLINFYQQQGILDVHIGCLYEWSRRSWQLYVCFPILHVFLFLHVYTLKTNDLTRWSTFTNNMLY